MILHERLAEYLAAVETAVKYLPIAIARMRDKIEQVCRANGYKPVIICTPEELLEE